MKLRVFKSIGIMVLFVALISAMPHLLDIVMVFVIAGEIPGTHHSIGAEWMFFGTLLLAALVTLRIVYGMRATDKTKHSTEHHSSAYADNLPTRRFHSI